MKFIHIADVHWGMNPDSDRPWSRERARPSVTALRKSCGRPGCGTRTVSSFPGTCFTASRFFVT